MSHRREIQIAMPSTGEAEWQALRESLMTGWLTQGPKVAALEAAFAARHGGGRAVATMNCTAGLHLILTAMGVGSGDEVIVPSFTWVATANAVLYCGAEPVLADVDRATYNIDPADVAAKVTARTRAIVVVHLFGLCADVDAISAAAGGVEIVEDAACAAGATYKGLSAGTLGRAAAFSLHPRKSITAGEGGVVLTGDEELADRIAQLRNHGAGVSEEQRHRGRRPWLLPEFDLLGYNYRMTDLQGAVALVQLGKLDRFLTERRRWADYYSRELADVEWLITPTAPEGFGHAWQAYVCYVDSAAAPMPRNVVMERLAERGISTRPGTHAVHMLGYHGRRLGLSPDDLPVSRDCDRRTMAIPLHNRMTAEDYEYVVAAIKGLC